jgi:hypothetical protein
MWSGAALLLASLGLAGQGVPVAEPHVAGVFYYLDQDTEGLIALERQEATEVTRSKAMGFGGRETAISIPGARSAVRLPYGKPGAFVFTLDPGTNPYTYVQFFRLTVRKDTREVLSTEQVAGGRMANVLNRSQERVRIARHGKLSFKVMLEGPLAPGEYALSTPTSNVGYCFGVDEPGVEKR